jgi:RNA polymerase subunit RPABC4/transcription elongation factor Spt4
MVNEKREVKKDFIKICPNCGSTKVTMPPAGLDLKMTFRDYCPKCGNRGIFPEIEKSKLKEFQKKIEKEK